MGDDDRPKKGHKTERIEKPPGFDLHESLVDGDEEQPMEAEASRETETPPLERVRRAVEESTAMETTGTHEGNGNGNGHNPAAIVDNIDPREQVDTAPGAPRVIGTVDGDRFIPNGTMHASDPDDHEGSDDGTGEGDPDEGSDDDRDLPGGGGPSHTPPPRGRRTRKRSSLTGATGTNPSIKYAGRGRLSDRGKKMLAVLGMVLAGLAAVMVHNAVTDDPHQVDQTMYAGGPSSDVPDASGPGDLGGAGAGAPAAPADSGTGLEAIVPYPAEDETETPAETEAEATPGAGDAAAPEAEAEATPPEDGSDAVTPPVVAGGIPPSEAGTAPATPIVPPEEDRYVPPSDGPAVVSDGNPIHQTTTVTFTRTDNSMVAGSFTGSASLTTEYSHQEASGELDINGGVPKKEVKKEEVSSK